MYGWGGKVIYVDLSREKVSIQPLDPTEAKMFLGGRGLNSYRLFKMVKPGIDPLSPENVLAIGNGVLAGTPVGQTSRTHISTLSPLSGILGDGNAGGEFSATLKFAGYDQIVVTGRASKPTYIWIEDDHVELRDATDLWGLKMGDLVDTLRDIHGDDISVAGIGPAGEHFVRFATTMIDKYHSGARGSGAVWGSKNLKAIAVRGTKGVEVADPGKFYELAKEDLEYFKKNNFVKKIYRVIGTHYGLLQWYPGWKYFEKYLGPEDLPPGLRPQDFARFEVGRTQCYGCPIACKDVYHLPRWNETGTSSEFEALYALGANNAITDTEAVLKMEHMADEYGMDVITLGDTLAMAKKLYEKGIINDTDTGGIPMKWGDAETQIKLVEMIAYREGFGNKLAEGYRNFAKIIGPEALEYSYDVKGLSRGWYHVDFLNGVFTLAHATSTRGADHLRGRSWAYWENDLNMDPNVVKAMLDAGLPDYRKDPVGSLIWSERACALADSLGRCKGSINTWPQAVPLVWKYPIFKGLAMLLTAATGVEYTEESLIEVADRIYLIEMAFNYKQGIKKKHFAVPFPPEIKNTPKVKEEIKRHWEMVDEYLERRGCDVETTAPKRETLKKLGVEWVADEIEGKEFPEWDGPPLWDLNKYPSGR
jgi:aldehyde:ferredoxin oxidoreductase